MELKRKGLPSLLVVHPESPFHQKALEAELPVFPLDIRSEFDFRAMFKLAGMMRRKKCLLAHFHDTYSLAVGSKAASLAKVRHRMISVSVDSALKKKYFARRKYKKNIDAVIAVSEGEKGELIRGGMDNKKIHVIPSGIDFSSFEKDTFILSQDVYLRREFSFAGDDYLVGIVARLADDKDNKSLTQATRILKEHSTKIKIIVIGQGPLIMDSDKRLKDSSVEDIFFFLGFREDTPQILASLDVFVHSSCFEGMENSILNAMACQLPVVAAEGKGIPELVLHGDTGLVVPPGNPSALARAILKLYNNRHLASRLGRRGYEVIHQKFSCEAMARKIVDLYEKIGLSKWIRFHSKA
jgi:glycosyltransferase involved in cell wall biosynthesis